MAETIGILDIASMEVPEQEALPEGEHRVRITHVEEKIDKNGNPGYYILFSSDKPNTKPIGWYMGIPSEQLRSTNEGLFNASVTRIKQFVAAFGITSNNPTEWIGKEGFVILKLEESEEYGVSNRVKRFVVPR